MSRSGWDASRMCGLGGGVVVGGAGLDGSLGLDSVEADCSFKSSRQIAVSSRAREDPYLCVDVNIT